MRIPIFIGWFVKACHALCLNQKTSPPGMFIYTTPVTVFFQKTHWKFYQIVGTGTFVNIMWNLNSDGNVVKQLFYKDFWNREKKISVNILLNYKSVS